MPDFPVVVCAAGYSRDDDRDPGQIDDKMGTGELGWNVVITVIHERIIGVQKDEARSVESGIIRILDRLSSPYLVLLHPDFALILYTEAHNGRNSA